jgi:hypothetical protein
MGPDDLTDRQAGISWPCQELTSDPAASFFQPGSVRWHRLALAIRTDDHPVPEVELALQLEQELG